MMRGQRVLGALALTATVFVSVPGVASAEPDWDALARCESGGQWDINSGNGYHGGLQFDPDTWGAYKPLGAPAHAYDATKAQQIQAARAVLKAQGWKAWPTCSRKLGLR